jgi:hypothetical protein
LLKGLGEVDEELVLAGAGEGGVEVAVGGEGFLGAYYVLFMISG